MILRGLGDLTSWIASLADAITRQEGYYPGTRAYRNNNPGNLRDVYANGRWQIWPNLPHDDQGFTQFPTAAAGRAALERDLTLKANRGMSLEQIVYAWAPPSDGNNTARYLANVRQWMGIDELPTYSTTVYASAGDGGSPGTSPTGAGSWGAAIDDLTGGEDSDRTAALVFVALAIAAAVALS